MGKSLHVRNLDEGLVRRLKLRAAANNRSMEAEHRAILTEVLKEPLARSFEDLAAAVRDYATEHPQTPSDVVLRLSRDEAR